LNAVFYVWILLTMMTTKLLELTCVLRYVREVYLDPRDARKEFDQDLI